MTLTLRCAGAADPARGARAAGGEAAAVPDQGQGHAAEGLQEVSEASLAPRQL